VDSREGKGRKKGDIQKGKKGTSIIPDGGYIE
jgi:hypothetical protein